MSGLWAELREDGPLEKEVSGDRLFLVSTRSIAPESRTTRSGKMFETNRKLWPLLHEILQ